MPTLHLGVINLPYVDLPATKTKKTPNETTGDVAEILEAKYHVMEVFFQLYGPDIVAALEKSMGGALESVLMGAPVNLDPNGAATAIIEKMFKDFLTNKEMDALGYPGVPTKAALAGVSHRFKGKKGAPGRPSFVDTGAYEAAFKSWLES